MHALPTKLPTRALFWDIDGTLLVTGRAGMMAWERAFAAFTGGRAFPTVRPDGLTDHQIAAWLLGNPSPYETPGEEEQRAVASLVARYEVELAGALPLRQGRVLDNVRPVLEWLREASPGMLSWLVTGNTLAGGTAKLRHYGLSEFFRSGPLADTDHAEALPLAGSFSSRVEPRANIVRRALQMAQARLPGLRASEALVIGDTPHDIEGAHAIGVPVLAVATNTHTREELAAHGPWMVAEVLPNAGAFARTVRSGHKG
ncbi:MAG: HAD family hydrolase [Acidobacteria bacterium]|nr:HAD family hydrolase [Acidobacteriota bacterium]